jgi:group II intron reverse transcriptase/maturase
MLLKNARALCVPTVKDRVAQTAVLHVIEPILEKEFEECSFAFRKGRSVKQAVYKIKEYYESGYKWVVDADIDAFFDSVDHDLLVTKIKRYIPDKDIVGLIELWIKAEVWDGEALKIMDKGIPQGSPISPILANLFLDEFDEEMLKQKQRYVRFADDFLILCKSPEKAKESLEFTEEKLSEMLLKLDERDVVSFDEGFTYLEVIFVRSLIMTPFDRPKKERKVLYYPQPMNMSAYLLKKKRGW